jgi:hypothetical protein
MAIKLFGFSFGREEQNYLKQDKVQNDPISFVPSDAGSTAVEVFANPMSSGSILDVNGNLKTESEFINKYRNMAMHPEVDNAISEIVNEAITTDEDYIVKMDLDNVNIIDDNTKLILKEQFDEILQLLDFKNSAYEIFKKWYIDGRLYYHIVIDKDNPADGIKELRYVDPRKIREIKEIKTNKIKNNQVDQAIEVKSVKNEYFLYNESGFGKIPNQQGGTTSQYSGIKISKDSVVFIPSGETDDSGLIGTSFLHKAIKSLNELRTIEDAVIIYRLVRAPERRVWNVDVGNLPRDKAEMHLKKVADLQNNKVMYDSTTGAVKDDRRWQTLTQDIWLPKRSDGAGTTVDVLAGGQNLGNIEDIVYFQQRLFNALNVPVDRLNASSPFSGNTQEISRSEVKFDKFITRLRKRFQYLFLKCLEKHVVLKGLLSIEEFKLIEKNIEFEFARDNHFAELIDQQVLSSRVQTYQALQMTQLIGVYFSNKYIRRTIFKQTSEDITIMNREILEEQNDPLYAPPQNPDDQGGQPNENAATPPTTTHGSESSKFAEKQQRIENAKHIVNSLAGAKEKNPDQLKKYRSAVQVVAKNTE